MGRPSKNETKRSELLAKAKECFLKFGYEKTSLDDIASSMKMNKSSLYYYINNKEDLFTEILVNEAVDLMSNLFQRLETVVDPIEKFHAFFEGRTDVYISIIKLNGMDKETILDIEKQIIEIYNANTRRDYVFLENLLVSNNLTKFKGESLKTYINLLFRTVHSLKLEAVLMTDILDGNDEPINTLKENIKLNLNLLLYTTYQF